MASDYGDLGWTPSPQPQALGTPARVVKNAGRAFLLLLGVAHLGVASSTMNTDGVSYLDIGDAVFHGNWQAVLNPLWSPLYTVVLGATRLIFPVSTKWEYPLVHTVNFVILLLLIPCFEFFWLTFFRAKAASVQQSVSSEKAWWAVGYVILVITVDAQGSVTLVVPDLIAMGIVMLAAGLLLRVRSTTQALTDYMALGFVLGIGYLAKAAVFPIAFLFFAAAAVCHKPDRRHVVRVCIMVIAFAIVSLPFIFALSERVGRPTFGESGRLDWFLCVNDVDPRFWQGGPPGSGVPLHPPRQIWTSPDVYEFATPLHATYPLWYNPYYWYEGFRPHFFDVRRLIRVCRKNVSLYLKWFLREQYLPVVTILLFLVVLRGNWHAIFQDLREHWPLLLISAGAVTMYSLIHVEERYVGGYFLLLFAPLFLATGAFNGSHARIASATAIALAIMALPMLRRDLLQDRGSALWQDNINVATAVEQLGVRPGDQIAYFGDAALASLWAKLDRVSIVAEAPDDYGGYGSDPRPVVKAFWLSSESEQAAILEALTKTGVKAVVGPIPVNGIPNSWRQVGNTRLCIKFLT